MTATDSKTVGALARQADRDASTLTDPELVAVIDHGRSSGVRFHEWGAAWQERERREGRA